MILPTFGVQVGLIGLHVFGLHGSAVFPCNSSGVCKAPWALVFADELHRGAEWIVGFAGGSVRDRWSCGATNS